ncbi:hypothetical protein [Variovorax sp. UMC13]|uniref:hypothetical protein n=1 Tax=Variovorax sp. UMC13 TaxID=1862326 RepID=UPI0016042F5C|nr:hypothetical protein [Variovorax sp. UMC13]MBB1601567.1 hypothetical protein [Variovorax sp. UMC13]
MSTSTWLLAVVLASLASAGGGIVYGHAEGEAAVLAKDNAKAVKDLTGLIGSHAQLITEATKVSKAMRVALTRRGVADAETTQEFKNALAATADSRAGCLFDDDVMRRLATAQGNAAKAAAGGVLGTVPGPGASTVGP